MSDKRSPGATLCGTERLAPLMVEQTMPVKWIPLFLCLLAGPVCFGAAHAPAFEGRDALNSQSLKVTAAGKKGIVVVFLSAVCPCSNSHVGELATLAKEHPNFAFVGVHSNSDEPKEITQKYFHEINLPFPIIQDEGAKIADELKAYKTPHAFVVLANGDIAYRGGVSSSRNFAAADKKFLRDALEDLDHNRAVRTAEGRTLGCIISRGSSDAW